MIVACFNDGATLPEALASLEDQEPHELVVVDDGSDDPRTLAVLRGLEERGVRVLRQENQGPARARTAGLHATSAPFVRALDADDVEAPGIITVLADALETRPELDMVWGDVQIFGEVSLRARSADELDPWLITYVNQIPADALVRREALLAAGGWRLEGGYEDWDLWMALAERGYRGERVPVLSGWYRVHGRGRVQGRAVARHSALVAEMRRRHPALFGNRDENRRRSRAPLRAKVLLPLIERLPGLSPYGMQRAYALVLRPQSLVRVRLSRLARIMRRAGSADAGREMPSPPFWPSGTDH